MLTADFSKGLPDLRAGIYRHWKGNLYQVIGYAHDANAEDLITGAMIDAWLDEKSGDPQSPLRPLGERAVVIYFGLELDEAHTGPRMAVRTAEDFFALVCSACGSDWECDQPHIAWPPPIGVPVEPVARFTYVAAEYYPGHRTG